jgi:hypothetical protein
MNMIAKCTKCQHEWQAVNKAGNCGWCGAPGYKLADDYMEDEEYFTQVCNDILASHDPRRQLHDGLAPLMKGLQEWDGRIQDGTLIGEFLELLDTHETRSEQVYQFIVDHNDVPGFEITAFTIILLTERHQAAIAKVILQGSIILAFVGVLLVLIVCL